MADKLEPGLFFRLSAPDDPQNRNPHYHGSEASSPQKPFRCYSPRAKTFNFFHPDIYSLFKFIYIYIFLFIYIYIYLYLLLFIYFYLYLFIFIFLFISQTSK